ncbi:MAG TPA: hypothetical protein VK081_02050 [Planctomycetota bacterium]|nr:hypothetical protein [Planctomycetota bacterium]
MCSAAWCGTAEEQCSDLERHRMGSKEPSAEELIAELMERPTDRSRRVDILRELVRRGDRLPEAMLDEAMRRLMDLLIR